MVIFIFRSPILHYLCSWQLEFFNSFCFSYRARCTLVPGPWQSFLEMVYICHKSCPRQIGPKGTKYFPVIFTLFTFILFSNLIGMVPYSFTTTSHFLVTFTLSFAIFVAVTIIGFQIHGLHFFSFLLPPGAPLALAPFLVVIELVSYCFRGISLGVRLFANMMAGHTQVKILSGFYRCSHLRDY